MDQDKTASFYNYLSQGCRMCYEGAKMVLFVTGICGKNCFYCPVSNERREKDVIFANENRVQKDEDLIDGKIVRGRPRNGRPGVIWEYTLRPGKTLEVRIERELGFPLRPSG